MRSPKVLRLLHEAKAWHYISVRPLLQYDPLRTYFTPIYVVRPFSVVQHEVKESVLVHAHKARINLATTLTVTCEGKDSFTPQHRAPIVIERHDMWGVGISALNPTQVASSRHSSQ